jgi:hypothetical protein
VVSVGCESTSTSSRISPLSLNDAIRFIFFTKGLCSKFEPYGIVLVSCTDFLLFIGGRHHYHTFTFGLHKDCIPRMKVLAEFQFVQNLIGCSLVSDFLHISLQPLDSWHTKKSNL